jgi:HEAT repeat protein
LHQVSLLAATPRATRAVAVKAVREAALSDSSYGVRADAVAVAGTFGDSATVTMALRDQDQRVRLAAERAAGAMSDAPAHTIAVLTAMSNDADPNVAAGALASLGSLQAPGAYETLLAALRHGSFRETVARGALRGLAAYGDMRAYSLVRARTVYGTQEQERNEAIAALAALAKRGGTVRTALPLFVELASRDPLISTRIAAIDALDALGVGAAIPALRHVERSDSQLLVQIEAWNAILDIKDAVAMSAYEKATSAVHDRRGTS